MESSLIFAPLIRVSTETQEKRGESLNTQRIQLESAINSLGGKVFQWYAGQEHATPEQERKILSELIHDAQHGKFGAVIVCDTSRWSRDNRRSKDDLKVLKENNIRFFVGITEYNLFNPMHEFMLSMSVEMAEFHAKEQTYKSILNRISRAKKGCPSCGKQPYGRTFDRQTGRWIVDQRKKILLEQIADTYLRENIGYSELGARFRMNGPNLRKILIKRSGSKWEQRFRSKLLNIDESVVIEIPALLSEDTIAKIKEKSEARRMYAHGSYKYDYLLSRIIFDAETGYALTGTPSPQGQRYYKPYQGSTAYRYMINADVLEEAVLDGLNELLINADSFHKAIFDGNPIAEIADDLKEKERSLMKKITLQRQKSDNLMTAIEHLEEGEVESFVKRIRGKIQSEEKFLNDLQFQLDTTRNQLKTLPTYKEIKDKRDLMREALTQRTKESYLSSGCALKSLPFNDKKEIILLFFGGKDENDKKYGIYITCKS